VLVIKNKKAFFEYFILETFSAGLKLVGSEVKSIRNHKVSIAESFCHIVDGEVFIKNMNIAEYSFSGPYTNHEPTRERKLLLHRKEISKLEKSLSQKGTTLIPLSIIITKTGLIKMEIGLAKGKKLYDKRETIKSRDNDRNLKRFLN